MYSSTGPSHSQGSRLNRRERRARNPARLRWLQAETRRRAAEYVRPYAEWIQAAKAEYDAQNSDGDSGSLVAEGVRVA